MVAGAQAAALAGCQRHGARDHTRRPAGFRAVHVPRGDRDRAPARRRHRQRGARARRAGARPALGRRAGVPAVPGRRGGARTAAAVAPMRMSFVAPGWLSLWMAFLLPLAALACAALIRRAHSRSGESQAWLDAAIVSLTLLPLAVVVAWPE